MYPFGCKVKILRTNHTSATTMCPKRHDLSTGLTTLKPSHIHARFHMFWIALLGLTLSWLLTKLGFLSATVAVLTLALKVLLIVLVIGVITAMVLWFRRKT